MYLHLNKKITVPNCSKVRSIAWNSEHDFIACGGENGVLKVIRLETNLNNGSTSATKSDSTKNFSHNQNLESHKSTVQYVCWNEPFQKLTSSDESGSIIVWMLYKGMWYEEMVNNRNKSLVTGMAWTADGQKICIVYDDGAIITGGVDGNRIWGKELRSVNLTKVEWSPDGKDILIGTNELEVQIFDNVGNFVKKMPLSSLQTMYGRPNAYKDVPRLVCIKWFKNGATDHPLIIAFEDGWIQLMKNHSDDFPLLLNTELKITSVEWDYTGDMFAVTGNGNGPKDEGLGKNYLKLYNGEGEALQTVKVPGSEIFDCSWNRSGLKLALAVDSYIFFATVKPHYQWGYLSSSVVFALPSKSKLAKRKKLIFWELESNATYEKEVNNFCLLSTWLHCCAVVAKISDPSTTSSANEKKSELHALTLFNSIGALIDRHVVNLRVRHCCLNSSRMIVTSEDSFYIWSFSQPYASVGAKHLYNDRLYNELTLASPAESTQSATLISRSDLISCVAASEKNFVIGHQSGTINQFLLPNAVRVHQIQTDCIPYRLTLNRNSSRLALIDRSAKLHMYDFDANNEETSKEGDWLDVKMQDVWDMKWAEDNNDMIAICEKNRLTIMNGGTLEREEPISSNGYIVSFESLTVKTILLDNLVVDSLENKAKQVDQYLESVESQMVRELKDIVSRSLTDAVNYALQWPAFPSLWGVISEQSLQQLQLDTALLAMVKCKDYKGIQFVKRLGKLNDNALKEAEVCAYLKQFEEAEKIYIEQNRPELAISLSRLMGNYKHTLQLLDQHHIADYQKETEMAHGDLARQYADQCEWAKAAEHFEKVDAFDELVTCYIHLENCDGLVRLLDRVSNVDLLTDTGIFLQSMGLCKESVRALIKANKVESAIKVCVSMSEWKMAIELAHEHRIENIDSILSQYVEHLLSQRKYIEIIEVYRKANKITEATSMVMRLIGELKKANKGDTTIFKKLFLLIGLLYNENRSRSDGGTIKATLDDLLTTEEVAPHSTKTKLVEDPWKGAEAYHFLLLTQRHLYEGYFDLAMKTALHLQNYEEFLPMEEIYSLIALASYNSKCFLVCSKAFIKLEALSTGSREQSWNAAYLIGDSEEEEEWRQIETSEEEREKYEKLAVDIFAINPPNEHNLAIVLVDCKFCGASIPDYSTSCIKCNTKYLPCIASGKSIMDSTQLWSCKQCAHQAIKTEIKQYNNCPLCHFKIEQH